MCQKCNKKSCSGGCSDSSMAEIQSQLDSILGFIDNLTALTRFLKGHPILALEDAADISQFDFSTGIGSGDWIGWGICNGVSYTGPLGAIATPDLRDRFMTGALGSYSIGNTGGANAVTLIVAEIPSHTHGVTDPGHTHIVTDPGHDHNVTDPGHTHAASSVAHQHTFTTNAAGDHNHSYDRFDIAGTDYDVRTGVPPTVINFNVATSTNTSSNGSHTHTGTTDMATPAINVVAAFTGIDMDDAFTGISNQIASTGVTVGNTGGSGPHENRPPFYAVLFVKKIF